MNPEDQALPPAELVDKVQGRDGVLTAITDRIDAAVMDAAGPLCKIFANYAVGFHNFDLDAATKRGIILTNTPGLLDNTTATHAWALLLTAARRIAEANHGAGEHALKGLQPSFFLGLDIDGKTLGIAGLGKIGLMVAQKARGFGMKIIYSDVRRNQAFEQEFNARPVDKETLLKESDFLSLHLPLLPETRHYIGEQELTLMKKTSVLINTGRGAIVDEHALSTALRNRTIRAAGLDVREKEAEDESRLRELDNVVVVPQIASAAFKMRLDMGTIAVNNMIKVFNGVLPDACVNPEVLHRTDRPKRAVHYGPRTGPSPVHGQHLAG
jgi:lactate dehydrogenase-like 2-hydroxyacid dehydrogenase